MHFEIAKDIYEHKYQDSVSYDQYLGQVEHGLDLLGHNRNHMDVEELQDMNMALEYNKEIMLKLLME